MKRAAHLNHGLELKGAYLGGWNQSRWSGSGYPINM